VTSRPSCITECKCSVKRSLESGTRPSKELLNGRRNMQCVRKVAVELGSGTEIWLSILKLPLKCAVVSLYSPANSG
jgi:hypothetical protein